MICAPTLHDAVEAAPEIVALYNRYITGDRSVLDQLEAAIQAKVQQLRSAQ